MDLMDYTKDVITTVTSVIDSYEDVIMLGVRCALLVSEVWLCSSGRSIGESCGCINYLIMQVQFNTKGPPKNSRFNEREFLYRQLLHIPSVTQFFVDNNFI